MAAERAFNLTDEVLAAQGTTVPRWDPGSCSSRNTLPDWIAAGS
jgi:hypothetical protein